MEEIIGTVKMRTFSSVMDFFAKSIELFKGATILMTLLKVKHKFREKILLTVAMANNCYG